MKRNEYVLCVLDAQMFGIKSKLSKEELHKHIKTTKKVINRKGGSSAIPDANWCLGFFSLAIAVKIHKIELLVVFNIHSRT